MSFTAPAVQRNFELFTNDSFLDIKKGIYGRGSFALELSDYSKLFSSLNFIESGFGRHFFENDKKNWCRWTFNINNQLIDVYSSSFNGKFDNYPTFVIDFIEHSTASALEKLFNEIPSLERLDLNFFVDKKPFENDLIRLLFNNFLKTMLINSTSKHFSSTVSIKKLFSTNFEEDIYEGSFWIDDEHFTISYNGNNTLLFNALNKIDDNEYVFSNSISSFVEELGRNCFYLDDYSTTLLRSLFETHCKNEILHQFKASSEFQIKNLFQPQEIFI